MKHNQSIEDYEEPDFKKSKITKRDKYLLLGFIISCMFLIWFAANV